MTEEQEPKELEKKKDGIPTLVTRLHPIAIQVGEHVLSAMEQEDTVAVITTITGSKSGPQVVSIPLNPEHLQQVQGLIQEIHESDEPESVPCVGFHCYIDEQKETET